MYRQNLIKIVCGYCIAHMERPPPTLKTGFGEAKPIGISASSPLGQRLISLVFVLVKRAATTAALYCKHAQREIVTPEDIKLALKYHAKTFFDEDGMGDLEKDMHAMEELVQRFASEEATSDDVVDSMCDEVEGMYEEVDEECDDEESQACECDVCSKITDLDWDAWNPEDPAEVFLKTRIDEILLMQRYK